MKNKVGSFPRKSNESLCTITVKPLTWLRSASFPHMPATAPRLGHVCLIVRGQVYDGRMTIYTAGYILINVSSNIVCFIKYTDKYIAFIVFDFYGSGLQTQDL